MLGTAPIGSIPLGTFSGLLPAIVGSTNVTLARMTSSASAGGAVSASANDNMAPLGRTISAGLVVGADLSEHLASRATTNVLYDNVFTGAVVGGAIPTRFNQAGGLTGLNAPVVTGKGIREGMPYVEILWTGTPTTTGTQGFYFDWVSAAYPAAVGETWVASASYEILDSTGVSLMNHGIYGRTSSGTGNELTSTNVPTTVSNVITKYEASRTFDTAGTARVAVGFAFGGTAGVPLSCKVRFYPAQVELGTKSTDLIYCTNGPTTRNAFGIYSTASVTGAVSGSFNKTASSAVLTASVTGSIAAALGAENFVNNSALAGATVGVVGSGGALPSGWVVAGAATVEVQAVGVRDNVPYMKVRIQRTATGTEYPGLFIPCAGINPNTTYTSSIFAQVISGSGPNLRFNSQYRAAGMVYQGNFINVNLPTTWQRISGTGTSVANSAQVYFAIDVPMTAGQVLDQVIEIACPQLEPGSVVNLPKLTYGTASVGGLSLGDFAIQNYIPNSTWWSTKLGATPSSIQLNSATITTTGGTVGVDADGRYIEVWFGGTNASGVNKFPSVILSTATTTAAFGERWLGHVRIKLLGTIPAGVTNRVMLQELLGGSWLADNAKYITPQTVATQEFVTSLITQPTANNVFLTIGSVWPNGASGSFGVRIYDPQLEKNRTTPSIYVPTNGTAVTQSRNLGLIGSAQVYDRVCNAIIYMANQGTTNGVTNTSSLGTNLTDASLTYNAGVAPNGRNEAVLLQNTGAVSSTHNFVPPGFTSVTLGMNYVASVFLRQSVGRYVQVVFQTGGFGTAQYANFDTQTGTFTAVGGGVATWVESWGDGWWRIGVRGTATATASSTASYAVIGTATQGRNAGYLNSTDNILIWGPKFERSDTMTPFNPTVGSAAALSKWGPSLSAVAQAALGASTNITLDPIQRTNLVTPFVQGWSGYAATPVYTDALGPTGEMDAKTFTMQDVVNMGGYQGGIYTTPRKYFGQITNGLWVKADAPVVINMGQRDGQAPPYIVGTTWQQIQTTNVIPGPDTSSYQNGTRIMQWFVRRADAWSTVDNSTVPLSTRIWVARPQANFGPTLLPFTEYGVGDAADAVSASLDEHMSLPARTNFITDPEFTNTPGFPTGMSIGTGPGVTATVTSRGKLPNGDNYFVYRIVGTNSLGGTMYPDLHFTTGVAISQGQVASAQVTAQIVGGSSAGFVNANRFLSLAEYNGSSYLAGGAIGVITGTQSRISGSRVMSRSTTNNVRMYIDCSIPAGNTVDISILISAPMLEIGQPSPYVVGSRSAYGLASTATAGMAISAIANAIAAKATLTASVGTSIGASLSRTMTALGRTISASLSVGATVSKTLDKATSTSSVGKVIGVSLTKTLVKATSAGWMSGIRRWSITVSRSLRGSGSTPTPPVVTNYRLTTNGDRRVTTSGDPRRTS